jgi:hypothetical protein
MPLLKRKQSKEENTPSSNSENIKINDQQMEKTTETKALDIPPSPPPIPKEPLHIRLKEGWKTFWDLFLGRTDKQKLRSKLTYVGRKYFLFFFVFLLYSGILLYVMQNAVAEAWYDKVLSTLCFNNPYQFGIGLTLMFIELAFLFSNEKILKLIFEIHTAVKQIGLIIGLIMGNFYFAGLLLHWGLDLTIFLSVFAMMWMVFQSVRIYTGSRKFASGLESKWVSQYGMFRYMIAIILPYIILGFLVVVAFFFRFGSVILALDYISISYPNEAFALYRNQMRIIMPMLYIELILVFVFIIMQSIFTQVKGSTKRAGVFDSLTYALITFMMFWYVLYNNALFMVTDQNLVNAINSWRGNASTSSAFFIVEFAISSMFLFWILIEIKQEFETGLMFLNNDGLVLLLLSTIMAQTTSRVGLLTQKATQLSVISTILSYDRIIIPFLIITILGLTIVLYYRNPQEGSMFLREVRVTSTREERTMDTILKYFKREFIRSGHKIPIDEHLPVIQKIIGLPPNIVMNLIHEIDYFNVDVNIVEELDDKGNKVQYFDFIPITEKYQRGTEAEAKAVKYLREQFVLNISKERASHRKVTPQQLVNVYWNDLIPLFIRSFDLRGYQETQLNKFQIAHPLHFEPYVEISRNIKLARKEAKKKKKVPKDESKNENKEINLKDKNEITEAVLQPTVSSQKDLPKPKNAEFVSTSSDIKTVKISKSEPKLEKTPPTPTKTIPSDIKPASGVTTQPVKDSKSVVKETPSISTPTKITPSETKPASGVTSQPVKESKLLGKENETITTPPKKATSDIKPASNVTSQAVKESKLAVKKTELAPKKEKDPHSGAIKPSEIAKTGSISTSSSTTGTEIKTESKSNTTLMNELKAVKAELASASSEVKTVKISKPGVIPEKKSTSAKVTSNKDVKK